MVGGLWLKQVFQINIVAFEFVFRQTANARRVSAGIGHNGSRLGEVGDLEALRSMIVQKLN